MKRKFLSTILALAMVFSLLPTAAFAASTTECSGTCTHVAAITANDTTTHYDTLADAINEAAEGQTVTLLQDIAVSDVIEINKNLTLDLNGKTVTNNVTGDRIFHVTSAVTFEINGTAEGSAMVIPDSNTESLGFVKISAAATVTLNGGSYTGNTDGGAFIKVFAPDENSDAPDATITLNGVTATTNTRVLYTDTADKHVLNVIGGD